MIKLIMTEDVTSVKEDSSLLEVKDLFDSNEYHHLPVTDESNTVVGILSKLDFNMLLDQFTIFKVDRAEKENQKFLRAILAKDVMTVQVATIGPEDPIEEAVEAFLTNCYHCLPVVDDGRLVGIVTTHDLLKYYSLKDKQLGLKQA